MELMENRNIALHFMFRRFRHGSNSPTLYSARTWYNRVPSIMHDILTFHSVHGSSISLSDKDSLATRLSTSVSDGIAFSAYPLKPNQRACVQLTSTTDWVGSLRIGFTVNDPVKASTSTPHGQASTSLPQYLIPDLTKTGGFWTRSLDHVKMNSSSVITIYANNNGCVYYIVNKEFKGLLLNGVPSDQPLWLVLDVYGNTTSARLIRPGLYLCTVL